MDIKNNHLPLVNYLQSTIIKKKRDLIFFKKKGRLPYLLLLPKHELLNILEPTVTRIKIILF